MKRLTILIATTAVLALAASANASVPICVPSGASADVKTPESGGGCKAGATKLELPNATQLATLDELLPHVSYIANGVGGKPTVRFTGVNVQIVNGEGTTDTINGDGNLVLGYDEEPGTQTGSHSVILGNRQTFTSYGTLLAGDENFARAPFVVLAGRSNAANAENAVAGGGTNNAAQGINSVVEGGEGNTAEGTYSWVGSGRANLAEARFSSIFGGQLLTATKEYEALP